MSLNIHPSSSLMPLVLLRIFAEAYCDGPPYGRQTEDESGGACKIVLMSAMICHVEAWSLRCFRVTGAL